MITLNEIAYNIKNLAYGGSNSTESTISIAQIKHWIHYHRAKLIADNIDKGITNNEKIYQKAQLTLFDSTLEVFSESHGMKTTSGGYANSPKATDGKPNGEWIPYSSLAYGTENYDQSYIDASNRNYYGIETKKSQIRGDFRNFGWMQFFIPETLMLKDDRGIKEVAVSRIVHFPSETSSDNVNDSFQKNYIQLYRKNNNHDEFNKFTDKNTPHYEQFKASIDTIRKETYNPDYTTNSLNILRVNNLQVSPNYHGGLDNPSNKEVFWKYRGFIKMILENPLHINNMKSYKDFGINQSLASSESYPIPMEYVSDLVQRVIQVEMQTELKTNPEEITDNSDDNIKLKKMSSGSQVQR